MGEGESPGEKICKLGANKSVYCKMFPQAVWISTAFEKTLPVSLIYLNKQTPVCPATNNLDPEWLKKVEAAKRRLTIFATDGVVGEESDETLAYVKEKLTEFTSI